MKSPRTTLTRTLALSTSAVLVAGLASASPASADNVDRTPTTTVKGELSGPIGIQDDAAGNIYVASQNNNSIVVHAKNASGPSSPLRRIGGPLTGLSSPRDVALDSNGFLYVVQSNGMVRVFSPGANGNVAPAKSFGTGPAGGWGIDVSGGEIYVRKNAEYHVYAPSATGSPATAERKVGGLGFGWSIAVDGSKVWTPSGTQLRAYSASAEGPAATPLQTVTNALPATEINGIDTDAAGRVHVTTLDPGTVRVFAPSADGTDAPLKVLGGPATGFSYATGLTVLSSGGLAVANYISDNYMTFSSLFPAPKAAVKKPGKVRALRVGGAAAAKNRKVRWVAPKSNGGAAIKAYRVVVRKGNRILLVRNLGPGRRTLVLKRGQLRKGINTVRVQAKNAKGFGPVAKKSFRVRK